MSTENQNQISAATEGCAAAAGYVACRIYADAEKDALMQALYNLSESDKDGAPYPADDMIYCILETTPHTKLISNLVDELHKLGYTIRPHTDRIRHPGPKTMNNIKPSRQTADAQPGLSASACSAKFIVQRPEYPDWFGGWNEQGYPTWTSHPGHAWLVTLDELTGTLHILAAHKPIAALYSPNKHISN